MISSKVVTVFMVAVLKLVSTQTEPHTPSSPTPTRAPLSLTCPDDITADTDHDKDIASSVTWDEPVVNHQEFQTMVMPSSHSPPPLNFKFTGEAEVITYTVTGGAETATCSFTVMVVDDQSPRLTCPGGANLLIAKYTNAQSPRNGAVVEYDYQLTDNTGHGNVMLNISHASGDEFPYGLTHVKIEAMDKGGNSDSCSFDVIVKVPSEECKSDIADSCSSLVNVKSYEKSYVEIYWPLETDPSINGQYIINYGPEGESADQTQYLYIVGSEIRLRSFTKAQKVDGLKSGTLYTFEVTKRYNNGSTVLLGSVIQRTKPSDIDQEDILFSEIKPTSVRVTWTVDAEQDEFDQFHVFYTFAGVTFEVGYFPKTTNSVLLTNLAPQQTSIVVTVEIIAGSGDLKTTSNQSKRFSTVDVAEKTLEIKNSTENSLAVTWSDIPDGTIKDPYSLYLFNNKKEQIAFVIDIPGYPTPYYPVHEFSGLKPLTSFTIVMVYNGNSAFRTSLTHKTRPKRIENLRASVVSDDSFTLTWDRPRSSYPDEYQLFISPHDNTSLPLPVLVADNEFTFRGLKNLTDYYVTVISIEEDIESVPVNEVITTGVPVTVISGSSVDLGVPITIGAALGVVIVFLLIIIFFLLCLIPCSTKPLPLNVANGVNAGVPTKETYAYAESTPKPAALSATMPALRNHAGPPPPRPPKKESTKEFIEMDGVNGSATEPNDGHVEPEPYVNMVIVNSVPEQKNLFGITLSGPGRKSLFHRKTQVDRPVISDLPGSFKKNDDDQIYDDVPQEFY